MLNLSKWPKTLIIMRHGQSERNVQKDAAKAAGVSISWAESPLRDCDTPLTKTGEWQCRVAGRWLGQTFPFQAIDAIIYSPYLRTVESTRQVIDELGYKPHKLQIDERIREIEFGILDGLTPEGIRQKFPEEVARRQREGKYWYRPPGGESRPDVRLRVHSFLDALIRDYRHKTVLVVCHSVIVQAFRSLLERWGESEYLQADKDEDVKNASLTIYETAQDSKKLVLSIANQACYEGLTEPK